VTKKLTVGVNAANSFNLLEPSTTFSENTGSSPRTFRQSESTSGNVASISAIMPRLKI
jgi:hypothetical protein